VQERDFPAAIGSCPVAKKRDFTTLYRGREGQWSWVAHRITGLAIIFFLFAHIVDTAVIGWGPDAYDRVMSVYENWPVRLLELFLVAMVVYHAINGVRIMIIDFWPKASDRQRQLFWGSLVAYVAMMIPVAIIMGREVLRLL